MSILMISLLLMSSIQAGEPVITETDEQVIVELTGTPAVPAEQGADKGKTADSKSRDAREAGSTPEESKPQQPLEQADRIQFKRQNMRNDVLQQKEIRNRNIQER